MEFWTHFYFYACAFVAVCGALATVTMANPIRGAMGLLLMIVSLAGLFLAAHAQFLAAVQLIVYAGAIVVLFLFVIMLLGPDATPPHDHRGRLSRTFAGGLFALLSIGALVAVTRGGMRFAAVQTSADFGGIDHFGRVLFAYGLVPFELSSALLMVAVIGAVAVARGKDSSTKHVVVGGLHGPATTSSAAMSPQLRPHEISVEPAEPAEQGGE
jgi:NADH-quinone oxidoreductase subunit J